MSNTRPIASALFTTPPDRVFQSDSGARFALPTDGRAPVAKIANFSRPMSVFQKISGWVFGD